MHLEKLTLCFLIRYTFSSLEKEGCVFIRGEITISWESHGDVFPQRKLLVVWDLQIYIQQLKHIAKSR